MLRFGQIETLPTRNADVQPLQNVLSISTAGKNRYLLHFNSLHSLTQWTAGIRLAMFELASLQELYTGSLIAGKGKSLNNIRMIMEKTKFKTEDWTRVRFGAGTPWRRCWCVIEPADEKANKSLKKKSVYERGSLPKGVIKFYDTKKTKKAVPIATITDAYAAYAIYPQSKSLIDQSTLVKVEGRIIIHSKPESKTEGFVFVMPELHPAVTGFEMMLRWLFPVYDVFQLYGRPQRLVADTWDTRGLMFAMPRERRYGYLDIIDVAALIHTQGSDKWSEREWRKQLKEATSKRISMTAQARSNSSLENRRTNRGVSESRQAVHYDDEDSTYSSPPSRHQHNQSIDAVFGSPKKAIMAPTDAAYLTPGKNQHARSVSESVAYLSPGPNNRQRDSYSPSRLSAEYIDEMEPLEAPPPPPAHRNPFKHNVVSSEMETSDSRYSSDDDGHGPRTHPEDVQEDVREATPPAPVMAPPNMQHQAGDVPQKRPDARPDLRREKSRMSSATLSQIVDVNKLANSGAAGHAAMVAWNNGRSQGENQGVRGVNEVPQSHDEEMSANQPVSGEVVLDGAFTKSPADVRPERSQLHPDQSIPRKPIPRKPIPTATTTSTLLAPPARNQSAENMSQYSASDYDRQASSSPDYDSVPEDKSPPVHVRRTRTGVLKTVGDPKLGTATASLQESAGVDIPVVDFGTTFTPALTPGHSRPATASGIHGLESPLDRPLTAPTTPLTRRIQDERSPPNNSPGTDEQGSPLDGSGSRPTHSRSSSYAWRPGSGLARHDSMGGLTAEEFVLQRATSARVPQGYAPHRSVSYSKVEQSADNLPRKRNSMMGRPSSRNSLLVDYAPHLTAREQEHVAKMTGGPLIQVHERSKTPDPSIGLIGAIEAREAEKRNIKEGLAGHMVQQAIAQRQTAEHNYGTQQYGPYASPTDIRQSGQWTNPQATMSWGAFAPQQLQYSQQTQQPWPNQSAWQYHYQQQQQQSPQMQNPQQNQMYNARFSGYYAPQGGYGYQ